MGSHVVHLDEDVEGTVLHPTEGMLAIVGFAGRDEAEVRDHIRELASHGVPIPDEVPSVWEVPADHLQGSGLLRASPSSTSGEVEPVLLRSDGRWFLTVGSDHTDRVLEADSILEAKEACGKVLGSSCWPLERFSNAWDSLILTSSIRVGDSWIPYQDGCLSMLRPLDWYLSRFSDSGSATPLTVFCGTVPTVEGLVLGASAFHGELRDPSTGQSLVIEYEVDDGTPRGDLGTMLDGEFGEEK